MLRISSSISTRRSPRTEMPATPHSALGTPHLAVTRRALLQDAGMGLGSIALSCLLGQESAAAAASDPTAPKPTHFPARAKSVIFLHMVGAPSQLDLFDYKPTLQE